MKTEFSVNKDILIWAIERAGFSLEKIFHVIPNFKQWIDGTKKPTLKQLETFAQKVYLPFGYLFLDAPYKEDMPIPYFRTGNNQSRKVSLNVYDTILLLQNRQDWLAEYLKENKYKAINFVGKFSDSKNIDEIVSDIRNILNLKENWASQFHSWEQAKDFLVRSIENTGVIVSFNSVVGNNTHRKISVEECRGLVLVNEYAPFMFLNSADAKSAQMFTIAHELAHIWIGQSAGFDFRRLMPADNPKEILCDKVAAEFLVPQNSFQLMWNKNQEFKYLARHFKVSQIVIARRALDLEKINPQQFFEFYDSYTKSEFYKNKKGEQAGGGDFYLTQKRRLCNRFLSFVNQAVKENKLLYRDAYSLTGLKGNTFEKMLKKL
jgi:Zn-dependent peptidase ImmA (M78 family)